MAAGVGIAVLLLLLVTFVLPGSIVINPVIDLRDAGRLWWLPSAVKNRIRQRWPSMDRHLKGPAARP